MDPRALAGARLVVQSPPDAPQLAFVHSTERFDGEWRGSASLQGRYWITGRIRLDARGALRARLAGRFMLGSTPPSDGDLCLQAYAIWGDRCVDHLAGDFAFVIWDGRDRRLMAVRDQLGVRTLFHAESDGLLMVETRSTGLPLDWAIERSTINGLPIS